MRRSCSGIPSTPGTSIHRAGLVSGTLLTFCATWLLRWLTVGFTNDHFAHLSRARQILFGEVPVRDFFDPGFPLHYYASAAALALSGNNLMGEAILNVTFIAFGAALTFYLAARASGSLLIAAIATAAAVATFPRLYNYPKVFLYVLALFWAWTYAERRTTSSLVALACVTAIAFLFRHDHGVYIGLSAIALIVLTHRGALIPATGALARYGSMTALFLLPFFAFIQLTTGILTYYQGMPEVQSIMTVRLPAPITIDLSAPLLSIDPSSEGKVSVRWAAGVGGHRRSDLEARYGLTQPVRQAEGTWMYEVTGDATDDLRALVNDRAVAGTSGIDPDTFRPVVHHRWLRELRNNIPLLRMRLAPGVFTEQNALAWLHGVTMLLPIAGLALMVAGWWRGTMPAAAMAALGTTVVMCAIINQGLIRESPDSRLADVAAPAAVLGAAVSGLLLRGSRLLVTRIVAASFAIVTLGSAAAYGHAGEQIASARLLAGPRGIREQLNDVNRQLHLRPIDWYAPPGSTGLRALTRYVFECTAPSDRLLVTWFAPEVFFYAERLFAGGQVYLDPGGWHASPADQQLTVRRLRDERVPITLVSVEWEEAVSKRFPLVHEHLRQHYVTAARSTFGGEREYAVLVARSLPPLGVYEPLGLPCFR